VRRRQEFLTDGSANGAPGPFAHQTWGKLRMLRDSGWHPWPPGADAAGHPIQDLPLLLAVVDSTIVEWLVVKDREVFVRRLQD